MKLFALLCLLAVTPCVFAEDSNRTAATTLADPFETAGTLLSYDGTRQALVVVTPDSTAPISYRTNSETELLDEENNPLTVGDLRANTPVTVFYTKTPTEIVATKVIVRKVIRSSGQSTDR